MRGLFEKGLLPSAVHKEFLRQLRTECTDEMDYHLKMADRSIIPRRMDVNATYVRFTRYLVQEVFPKCLNGWKIK